MTPFLRYSVFADHVAPQYAATALIVKVGSSRAGTYYADAPGYGCGKDAATPETAIRSLLTDNGCTNIRASRVYDTREEAAVIARKLSSERSRTTFDYVVSEDRDWQNGGTLIGYSVGMVSDD